MPLKEIDPDILALLSALIAADLAKGMDIEEQNVFGNFIVAVGSIILTMAAAEEAQKKAQEEAKAKADEAKKNQEEAAAKAATAKKTKPTTGEKAPAKPSGADEDSDILPGRSDYRRLCREQESLQRRLGELERLVAELGPGK